MLLQMISRRTFVISSLAAAGCATSNSVSAITNDEMEIYALLLDQLVCAGTGLTNYVVTQTESFSEKNEAYLSTRAIHNYLTSNEDRLGKALVEKFRGINAQPHQIEFDGRVKDCIELITASKAEEISPTLNAQAYFDEQREKRIKALRAGEEIPELIWPPSNITRFSRIGVNEPKDTAIIYKSNFCGSLCATGEMIELTNTGDGWQAQSSEQLWIS